MHPDFMTVFWKEWKEIILQRSAGGGGARQPLIFIALLGVFVPWRMGPDRFFNPMQVLLFTFLSAMVVTAVIADAFAGERERHTLETLLASRLSDRAILLGKIAASVAYGWMIALACVIAGTITVNLVGTHNGFVFYRDSASWIILLIGPPLVAGIVATGGVLISLHAATVRQAQQTLSIGFMVVILGVIFGSNVLPADWKAWFARMLVEWSLTEIVLIAAAAILVIDLTLLMAGMARFQRSKLVLD